MNPMEKHNKKTSESMTYLIDNKMFLCHHNKLYPLTARSGKWISEAIYRDIEDLIQHDSQKYITSGVGEDLSNKKELIVRLIMSFFS